MNYSYYAEKTYFSVGLSLVAVTILVLSLLLRKRKKTTPDLGHEMPHTPEV